MAVTGAKRQIKARYIVAAALLACALLLFIAGSANPLNSEKWLLTVGLIMFILFLSSISFIYWDARYSW